MNLQPLRHLGNGHFGEVWLAHDLTMDRQVAVKFLSGAAPGVLPEAVAQLEAKHRNVVEVFAAENIDGRLAIVMEYLPEGSVAGRYRGRPVPVAEALQIAADAARGLTHAHAVGLLHRDIKPANLLIDRDGSVKLSDFGLACEAMSVGSGPLIGYRPHLPPEAVDAGFISDQAGDVYATGVTLYRLLNGDDALTAAMSHGADLGDLVKAGKFPDRRRWLAHIPARTRRLVNKAMNIDPAKRPANASTLRRAIELAFPTVSFGPLNPAHPPYDSWVGTRPDGQVWTIEVDASKHSVEVTKTALGGNPRRVRSDCLTTESPREAVSHATRVMDRLARCGK